MAKVSQKYDILSAKWGVGDAQTDVTDIFRSRTTAGPFIPVTFGNGDGGDPAVGKVKRLDVRFCYDGVERDFILSEYERKPMLLAPAYYYASGMIDSPIQEMLMLPRDHSSSDLERSIISAGLSDGSFNYPSVLVPNTGHGLRIWQYPNQFAPYLIRVSAEAPKSYLEIGTMDGGTFAFTTEYLRRMCGLERACAVDINPPSPFLKAYASLEPISTLLQVDSKLMSGKEHGTFDLVMVDGDHSYSGCMSDLSLADSMGCRMVAVHDIVDQFENSFQNGVGRAWNDWKQANSSSWIFKEFTLQYDGVAGSWMGIGLAIRKK